MRLTPIITTGRVVKRSWPRLGALVAAVAALAFSLAACGGDDDREARPASDGAAETSEPGVRVIATTTILADITRNIACEDVTVETLLSPGQDPHTFELSARQAAELREADLIVANGLGLEESLEDVLLDARADGTTVVFLGEHAQPIPFTGPEKHSESEAATEEHAEDERADDEHGNGSLDPHVWMDPARMAAASAHLTESLSQATGVDHAACATTYVESLQQLDSELAALLEEVPAERRKLVTNHEALGYLAERYGFEIVGVVVPGGSTTAEPSAADIVELAETLEREAVSAIFVETTTPTELADLVASEAGTDVEIVSLYTGSLGEPGTEAETYIQMMRTNANRINAALND